MEKQGITDAFQITLKEAKQQRIAIRKQLRDLRKESEQHCLPKSNEKERGVRVLSLINVLEQPTPFLRPFVFAGKLLQSSNRTEVMEKLILGFVLHKL